MRLGLQALLVSLSIVLVVGCPDDPARKCSDPQKHGCSDGLCWECCEDEHCSAENTCVDNKCVIRCFELDGDCTADREHCCDGLVCDRFTVTCANGCVSQEDCLAMHPGLPFSDDLLCYPDGRCNFARCHDFADCQQGLVCYHGDCVSQAPCDQIASCEMSQDSVVTKTGSSVSLSATTYLATGVMAPISGIDWASDTEAVALVEAGQVTGGPQAGTALITASVSGCEAITCTATAYNHGPLDSGTRVVAVDELTGAPLEGIQVQITGVDLPVSTGSMGAALFPDVDLTANPATVSLTHEEYDWVFFITASTNDLIAFLRRTPDYQKTGGARGKFDFSKLVCPQSRLHLALAGFSYPGPLFDMSFQDLAGENLYTHIELELIADYLFHPSGLVIGHAGPEDLMIWHRDEFGALGNEGRRVAWGLGGRGISGLLMELASMANAQKTPIRASMIGFMSWLSDTSSDLIPGFDVVPIQRVRDVDDLDEDGDVDELVPFYERFPALPRDLQLKIPNNQILTVLDGEIPDTCDGGHCYNAMIVLAGVLMNGAGFIPLGIASAVDVGQGASDSVGVFGPMEVVVSDVAGRLPEGSYQRVVLALAVNEAVSFSDPEPDQYSMAGQVHFVDSFDTAIHLRPFYSPMRYEWDWMNGVFTVIENQGTCEMLLLSFDGLGRSRWRFLSGPIGAVPAPFHLPEGIDYATRPYNDLAVCMNLADGLTHQDLIAFGDNNMDKLDRLAVEFVVASDNELFLPDCATGSSRGGLVMTFVMLSLMMFRRRHKRP